MSDLKKWCIPLCEQPTRFSLVKGERKIRQMPVVRGYADDVAGWGYYGRRSQPADGPGRADFPRRGTRAWAASRASEHGGLLKYISGAARRWSLARKLRTRAE